MYPCAGIAVVGGSPALVVLDTTRPRDNHHAGLSVKSVNHTFFAVMSLLLCAAGISAALSGSGAAHKFNLWSHAAAVSSELPPESAFVHEHDVEEGEPAPRIGRYAGGAFASLGSTSQGVKAAKASRLLLNGIAVPMTARVRAGDEVSLLPLTATSHSHEADDERALHFAEGLLSTGALGVLYEDECMAIVDKPAGVHTKPFGAPLAFEHALPAVLMPPSGVADALTRPTAVHRLDRRVSGLVVVAKTRHAAACLAAAFRERRVEKRYRALVLGRLDAKACMDDAAARAAGDEGEHDAFDTALDLELRSAVDGGEELHVRSRIDGRPSHTVVRVLETTPHVQAGFLTTLDLQPLTGRRHQLRRHCQALGFPICGDDLYAAPGSGFGGKRSAGLFLQSVEVAVASPAADGEWVRAELPEAPKFRRQRERARLGWTYQLENGLDPAR